MSIPEILSKNPLPANLVIQVVPGGVKTRFLAEVFAGGNQNGAGTVRGLEYLIIVRSRVQFRDICHARPFALNDSTMMPSTFSSARKFNNDHSDILFRSLSGKLYEKTGLAPHVPMSFKGDIIERDRDDILEQALVM